MSIVIRGCPTCGPTGKPEHYFDTQLDAFNATESYMTSIGVIATHEATCSAQQCYIQRPGGLLCSPASCPFDNVEMWFTGCIGAETPAQLSQVANPPWYVGECASGYPEPTLDGTFQATTSDLIEIGGMLLAVWAAGYIGGYTVLAIRKSMEAIF